MRNQECVYIKMAASTSQCNNNVKICYIYMFMINCINCITGLRP